MATVLDVAKGGLVGKAIRSVIAVIAGFVAASVVMIVVETINGRVLYPELGKLAQGMTDRDEIRALMASAPAGAFLVVLVGWALGSFTGGYLAGWIAGRSPVTHALVLGSLLTLAGIANNLMIPPPVWFWFPTLAVFLPSAYGGGRLAPSGRGATRARD
jgi:hypothetical protein